MKIRDNIERWAGSTYGEMLESRVSDGLYQDEAALKMAREVLAKQKITDKFMNGDSTMGLLNTEKEVGKFQYVKVFNAISKSPNWCPVDMVYATCYFAMRDPNVHLKAKLWDMSESELITKMCGRALRALPSYLREYDLAQQLAAKIPTAKFTQSEALDTVLHADLKMERDGEEYYFWSYVNTPKSRANFEEKFFGHRQGSVPDGNHVTCPFSLDCCDDREGWKLYDPLDISAIVRMLDRAPIADYSKVAELSKKTDLYFQTPKLITKADGGEREIEEIERG